MPRTPDFAQDARVLNRLSGHSHSATRADLSGQAERARAAEARRSMRAFLAETERDQPRAA
jgi:hypothetical protein